MGDLAGILVILIALFYTRLKAEQSEQFRKDAELARTRLELEQTQVEQLNLSLKHAKSDIEQLALLVSKKEKLMTRLLHLSKHLKGGGNEISAELKKMITDVQVELNMDRGKLDIQRKAILINDQFYRNLDENYPNLTQADKELCGQLKMKLANKEIAVLRGVSPDSVTQAKSRLRKKMGLGLEVDLSEFLNSV